MKFGNRTSRETARTIQGWYGSDKIQTKSNKSKKRQENSHKKSTQTNTGKEEAKTTENSTCCTVRALERRNSLNICREVKTDYSEGEQTKTNKNRRFDARATEPSNFCAVCKGYFYDDMAEEPWLKCPQVWRLAALYAVVYGGEFTISFATNLHDILQSAWNELFKSNKNILKVLMKYILNGFMV